ncbi:MAG: twin-arginine translocase TatA/TatE family subunit [Acidimicrobiales bacterium]
MPSSLGPAEILVILVVALIVLGPNKLPQAGRQVGRALAEVRRWTQDMKNEVSGAFDANPEPPRAPVVDVDPAFESSLEVIPPATADYQPPAEAPVADEPVPVTDETPAADGPQEPGPDDRL